MTDAQYSDFLAVVGMASQTNALEHDSVTQKRSLSF